jgi:hypothetical protein
VADPSLHGVHVALLPQMRSILSIDQGAASWPTSHASIERRVILFAVTEFLGTGSQVPLLLVIDAI